MNEPREEPLEKLALAENDRGLVSRAASHVPAPRDGRRQREQAREEQHTPGEQPRAQRDRGRQQRGGEGYRDSLAWRIAALIAGTTSCRSPITA